MSYTGLIANGRAGKCLSAPTKDRDPMVMAACDPNDSKQRITISNNRLTTEYRNQNDGMINTNGGNVFWSGESGKDDDIAFYVESIDTQYPFPNGNFRFWG
ncbi:uncharacterized protein EV422DRAFT_502947 [Fimicolochytrium jonesii]|uniref:uncharacterized protein n=1 Tax=Fimicolochytrium jonesii TaxID=1396493 RepID=UPI0022FE85F5|nr:uncharacterized protein EV422DRAFT_502947 [Fimicolochytrium jonesii]KAI8827269.1 hypothetical protein EV422DRAFT_502947 [Fimicolochytrium jonesii]